MVTVIITGASSGIGLATAKAMYEQGYNVVVSSRNAAGLKEKVASFDDDRCVVQACDVRSADECGALFDAAVKRFGSVEIVVCNAGVGRFKSFDQLTSEDVSLQIETNLIGVFNTLKPIIPHFKDVDAGQVIIIGSMAARSAFKSGAAYCASKWGTLGLARCLKEDLRSTHVKVAIINPGSVDTAFFDKAGFALNPDRHLDPSSVALAVLQVAQQPRDSDIDEVIVRPALR